MQASGGGSGEVTWRQWEMMTMMFWYGGGWAWWQAEIDAEEYQRLRDLLDGGAGRAASESRSAR